MKIIVRYDDYELGITSAKVIFDKEEDNGFVFTIEDEVLDENDEQNNDEQESEVQSKGLVCDTNEKSKALYIQCIENGILGDKAELEGEDIQTLVKLLRNISREL